MGSLPGLTWLGLEQWEEQRGNWQLTRYPDKEDRDWPGGEAFFFGSWRKSFPVPHAASWWLVADTRAINHSFSEWCVLHPRLGFHPPMTRL